MKCVGVLVSPSAQDGHTFLKGIFVSSNKTRRECRLSDAKISDFDPKMGILQPFEPISRSKGCSFLRFV